jgi:hypothetical protein
MCDIFSPLIILNIKEWVKMKQNIVIHSQSNATSEQGNPTVNTPDKLKVAVQNKKYVIPKVQDK